MVITGSSRGLGRAFAIAAAAEGASVIVNGTNESALAETVEAVGSDNGCVIPVPGSVAEPEVVERLVRTCVEQFGGIDVMVNNAGIVRDRTLLKMSVEDLGRGRPGASARRVPLHAAGGAGHARNRRPHHPGHLRLGPRRRVRPGQLRSGKEEGMIGLLRTSLLEFARYGIRSNALWPVGQTDMTQVVFERARAAAAQQGEPPPNPVDMGFGTPEEVAAGLVWLASDGAARFNGQILSFNGRKTGLWTHPAEVHAEYRDKPWTVDELDAYYRDIEPQPVNPPVRARTPAN